jgi:riboflavin biosynthesis pyrimidine reductase
LTEAVPNDHLAELRRDGISYIFAGRSEIDLALALEILADEFGIKRLLLEGGGGINGSFLSAGLINEISLIITPIADGNPGLPTTFDRPPRDARSLNLQSVERLERDLLHLRYEVL